MREIELEFKQLLTASEYKAIMEHFDLQNKNIINNKNFYYDTKNNDLKNNNAALRIRHTDFSREMTLKIKEDKGNLEININIDDNIPNRIDINNLPKEIKEFLEKWNITSELQLIQKIVTERRELQLNTGLLVLDKTYFLGNVVDYELEFEVSDYNIGRIEYEQILKKFNIAEKVAKPKIARAFEYSKNKKSAQ